MSEDEHFFLNMFNVLAFECVSNLEKLRKPVDRDRWTTEPAVVNAFYNPNKNDIGTHRNWLQRIQSCWMNCGGGVPCWLLRKWQKLPKFISWMFLLLKKKLPEFIWWLFLLWKKVTNTIISISSLSCWYSTTIFLQQIFPEIRQLWRHWSSNWTWNDARFWW